MQTQGVSVELPDAETTATDLLKRVAVTEPPVLLPRVLSLWPDLRVDEEDLDGAGYLLHLGAHGAEIIVRRSDPSYRRRYTIAHELGHWLINSEQCEPESSEAEERWCEDFAAALLMPREQVLNYLRVPIPRLLDRIESGPRAFRVSRMAFRVRIATVSPISVAEIDSGVQPCNISRTFISRQVGSRALKTLDIAMPLLQATNETRVLVEETNMLALRRTEGAQWLVAITPFVRRNRRKSRARAG